jgi:hypothetical protein
MAICPLISSRNSRATCGKLGDGSGIPDRSTKESYCFDIYELCPNFLINAVKAPVEYDAIEAYENSYVDLSR